MEDISLRVEILSDITQKILRGLLQIRIRRCGHSRVNQFYANCKTAPFLTTSYLLIFISIHAMLEKMREVNHGTLPADFDYKKEFSRF